VHRSAHRGGRSLLIHSGVMQRSTRVISFSKLQQNSETTYRVYDWGRVGPMANRVRYTLSQSLARSGQHRPAPRLVRSAEPRSYWLSAGSFVLPDIGWAKGARFSFKAGDRPGYFPCRGNLRLRRSVVGRGVNAVCLMGDFLFTASADSVVLVTDGFFGELIGLT